MSRNPLYYEIRKNVSSFLIPYAMLRTKTLNQKKTLGELIDFSFDTFGGLIKPSQIKDEALRLLKILDEMRPKTVIEIGTANGGTLFLFSRISSEDATLISIDLPGGKFGGGYRKWKNPLYKSFALTNQLIHLIRSGSHSQATLEKVKIALNGEKVDFIFIDGDHTYGGVKRDFEIYGPLVKKNGIIAFYDIVSGPEGNVGGVPKFWREISNQYEAIEIVEDYGQGGYGIGVLKVRK